MKLIFKGEVVAEAGIEGALSGYRCDALQFDFRDICRMSDMLECGSEVEKERLRELLSNFLTKFMPSSRG